MTSSPPLPPLSGLSSGVSGASPGEAEGGGGAEGGHDHPGPRHGLQGQVQLADQNQQSTFILTKVPNISPLVSFADAPSCT